MAISSAQWQWVVIAVFVVIAGTFLKALRWQALFYPDSIGFGNAWSVFMIGQMLNAVLPARAGEIGRVFLIGEAENVSRSKALSSVIVEKMVDVVMLAMMYLITAIWLATTPIGSQDWLNRAGPSLLLLSGIALSTLLLFAYAGRPAWRILRKLLNPISPKWRVAIDSAVQQAIGAFEVLKHRRTAFRVWGLSFLIWMLSALTNILLFHAFQLTLSPYAGLFLLVVLMSGVAVPPLPGNLGVFPYLCQISLALFGIDRETALVYGLALQIVAYLPLVILGAICLLRQNWFRRVAPASSPPEPYTERER